jgi:hypothetical protein
LPRGRLRALVRDTSAGIRHRKHTKGETTMKKIIVGGVAAAAAAIGIAAFPVATAHADAVPPNCQVVPWGFLGLTQKRAICDGPIQPDGSWMRHRIQYVPAHYVHPSSSCSGDSYSTYCTYYEGGWVDDNIKDDETYPVTPDTIVPGEPGHLG